MIEYNKRPYYILANELLHGSRFIHSENVLKIFDVISKHMPEKMVVMVPKSILWRSQLGCIYSEEGYPQPYCKTRMFPQELKASEGRANPKGIPCIYLATSRYISIHEVRPWPGKYISLGRFETTHALNLIDFSSGEMNKMYVDFEKNKLLSDDSIDSLWAEINNAFSEPVNPSDDNSDYIVTQVIAELVKSNGYEGLIYNSNYSNSGNIGKNIVLFDRKAISLLTMDIIEIKNVSFDFQQIDNTIYYEK